MRFFIVFLLSLVLSGHSAWSFTPDTFSPDIALKESPEQLCEKNSGGLLCRWDGDCADLGESCASCTSGLTYSFELEKCYSCVEGTTLRQEENGEWICD